MNKAWAFRFAIPMTMVCIAVVGAQKPAGMGFFISSVGSGKGADFGGLEGAELEWSQDWAVTVVLASAGYPATSSKGDVITGVDDAAAGGAEVLHAGTAGSGGDLVTAGGRVLNVTGLGPSPAAARDLAYQAADKIDFDGKQMRRDIAARAVDRVEA